MKDSDQFGIGAVIFLLLFGLSFIIFLVAASNAQNTSVEAGLLLFSAACISGLGSIYFVLIAIYTDKYEKYNEDVIGNHNKILWEFEVFKTSDSELPWLEWVVSAPSGLKFHVYRVVGRAPLSVQGINDKDSTCIVSLTGNDSTQKGNFIDREAPKGQIFYLATLWGTYEKDYALAAEDFQLTTELKFKKVEDKFDEQKIIDYYYKGANPTGKRSKSVKDYSNEIRGNIVRRKISARELEAERSAIINDPSLSSSEKKEFITRLESSVEPD